MSDATPANPDIPPWLIHDLWMPDPLEWDLGGVPRDRVLESGVKVYGCARLYTVTRRTRQR